VKFISKVLIKISTDQLFKNRLNIANDASVNEHSIALTLMLRARYYSVKANTEWLYRPRGDPDAD